MKNILIIGGSGFLGSSLLVNLPVTSLCVESISRSILDLEKPITDKFTGYLENKKIHYVIICAAIADVEKCYTDKQFSEQVNVKGMISLLDVIYQNGAVPVFFSSDYVFSGKDSPYKENDIRNPLTTYGKQKQIVEEYIEAKFSNYLIFRTSKLMSKTPLTKNILYPVIQNLISGKESFLFEDQLLNPVFVEDIAKVLVVAIHKQLIGTFHLGTKRVFTRAELGRFLATLLGHNVNLIKSTYMKDINFSEKRPKNNSIDTDKIEKAIDFRFCEIEEAIISLKAIY